MGRKFTRFVHESETIDARIVAAVNRGEANLEVVRRDFGILGIHSVEEALDPGLDFVIISSTTVAHAEQVVAGGARQRDRVELSAYTH
jgi:predicted dehydrogenase